MRKNCELRAAHGVFHECDEEHCLYWRALEHLGSGEADGCAIEHHKLLADDAVSAWLLSVKERVELAAGGS